MCVPPHDEDPRPHFTWLADRAARHRLTTVSMGCQPTSRSRSPAGPPGCVSAAQSSGRDETLVPRTGIGGRHPAPGPLPRRPGDPGHNGRYIFFLCVNNLDQRNRRAVRQPDLVQMAKRHCTSASQPDWSAHRSAPRAGCPGPAHRSTCCRGSTAPQVRIGRLRRRRCGREIHARRARARIGAAAPRHRRRRYQ